MKKTALVAVVTTLIVNFLLAFPTLLLWLLWGGLVMYNFKLEKYLCGLADMRSQMDFSENAGSFLFNIICPPAMTLVIVIVFWEEILGKLKKKVKLPKIRNPFVW